MAAVVDVFAVVIAAVTGTVTVTVIGTVTLAVTGTVTTVDMRTVSLLLQLQSHTGKVQSYPKVYLQ